MMQTEKEIQESETNQKKTAELKSIPLSIFYNTVLGIKGMVHIRF